MVALQEVRLFAALREANLVQDQWLAHEQVLRAEAEAARQQTTRLPERITDLFVALDHEWRFIYRNWAAEQLLQDMQRTQAELIGKTAELPAAHIQRCAPPQRSALSSSH